MMQSTEQCGVSDPPAQFLVRSRAASSHIFSISHEGTTLITPAAGHSHTSHHQAHHQLHIPHHHYGTHLGHQPRQLHQPHPSSQASHQQIHQTQSSPHTTQVPYAQQAQQQLLADQNKQEQQQATPHPPGLPHQDVPDQHQHQAQVDQQLEQAQEQMVQLLGLGDPDSPEGSPTSYSKLLLSAQQDDEGHEEGRSNGSSTRWPKTETLALIQIRADMNVHFRDSGVKGPLWQQVARKLGELGYNRSAKKCKEKFENVAKYYKKAKDGKIGRQNGTSYRFFSQLDAIYGGQQGSTQVESGASLLALSAPPTEDLNVPAERPSEDNTAVTLSKLCEDDYDEPGSGLCDNQGREKKRRKDMEGKSETPNELDFFESLMRYLADNLQRKFLESMERMEQDRLVREEAWRRVEMDRLAREHDLRAQEHALATKRDAALIAFLQKVTGQPAQPPEFSPPPPTRDSED